MSRRHKEPGFLRTAGSGLALSIIGAALVASLELVAGPELAVKLAIAVLGSGSVGIALRHSRVSSGRIVAAPLWLGVAIGIWLTPLPIAAYVGSHVLLAWLVRAALRYTSIVAALVYLGVSMLACAVAAWAALRTGSPLLAFWCFFLVQALDAAIPDSPWRRAGKQHTHPRSGDRFEEAHRAAEAALGALESRTQ
jgi:hypothetical protein